MSRVNVLGNKSNESNSDLPVSVALAGNPNVGKSTLFNTLTGMHRHTGNWAGKTVSTASATVRGKELIYSIADIPGTYSLLSHSKEEEVARNYICFGGADITVVVCDGTALLRGLALALQIGEVKENVILCVNLIDEAERLGINIDIDALSSELGMPVISTFAHRKSSAKKLICALDEFSKSGKNRHTVRIEYPEKVAYAAYMVERVIKKRNTGGVSPFWIAMRLIEGDETLLEEIRVSLGIDVCDKEIGDVVSYAREYLFDYGIDIENYKDIVVSAVAKEAEKIANRTVSGGEKSARERDVKIDRILTGKFTAFPVMLLLLGLVFWLTISFANYPSQLLSELFSFLEVKLSLLLESLSLPVWFCEALIFGVYRTLSVVVSVMLPPMAIFFPLFTLLEDSGYLPRVAYNLDKPFASCGACGKQALTMCMGLGCNAVGISGARIIDSERERLLAILTNNFIPCNGRLPMLISIIGIALVSLLGYESPLATAGFLLLFIILSVSVTFGVTKLLSVTLLKGARSSFTIELSPYRKPEILRVLFRSLVDKTLKVLLRAVAFAAPMGLVIYLLSNLEISGASPILLIADFLDPVGKIMGLNGVILLAFILGITANETVIPIMIMIYTSSGALSQEVGAAYISEIFSENGSLGITAICTAIFALFHFPCSTSLITVYKETKSLKYTALSFIIPTAVGFLLCCLVNFVFGLLL